MISIIQNKIFYIQNKKHQTNQNQKTNKKKQTKTKMEIRIISGSNWPKADPIQWCDPYVVLQYTDNGKQTKMKTKEDRNTSEPNWNHTISFKNLSSKISVDCWDWDRFGSDDHLGSFIIEFPLMISERQTVTFSVNLEKEYLTKRKDNTKDTTVTIEFIDHDYLKKLREGRTPQQVEEIVQKKKLEKYLKLLTNVTKKNEYSLAFSSEIKDNLMIEDFQKVMLETNGIMIFIISQNGDIFGSYNSHEMIQGKEEDRFEVRGDGNACVFSWNNEEKQFNTYKLKEVNDTSLFFNMNASKYKNVVIGVQNAFSVKLNCSVIEEKTMGKYYNVNGKTNSILMNIQSMTHVPIDTLLIWNWK